ncbi:hypothetical protein M433DRAFT_157772 [Acidomyces richmondensis BFW]|nr:MAG: hypothetical protein FE78DRAFT_84318 [Acidomyces sp. 'richmondensis']KYG42530.1 hypothetical protein M433DRAFT_157772 [Acidomyces richmondensis BFW]
MLKFICKAISERYGADGKVQIKLLGSFVSDRLSQLQCEVEANSQIIAGPDSMTALL